jgi:beta-phosphoglucomutase-like phosphatase (HAD superfamily)
MTDTFDSMPDLVLIGSIGVVAHCSELQYNLFNQALAEIMGAHDASGNKTMWDKQAYVDSLVATGGKIRLKTYLRGEKGLSDEIASDENIEKVYLRKTELFVEEILKSKQTGTIRIRPGILEIVKAAKDQGIKTGFCTTTVKAVMDAFVTSFELEGLFDYYFSDAELPKIGYKGKPNPDCYLHAVKQILGEDAVVARPLSTTESVSTDEGDGNATPTEGKPQPTVFRVAKNVIAFEDTQISMEAPVRAGIPCVAIPSEWSTHQDFSKSVLMVAEAPALVGADTVGNDFAEKVIEVLSGLCTKGMAANKLKA